MLLSEKVLKNIELSVIIQKKHTEVKQMSKTEIYDGEISVEGLRKFFQEKNDFTSMPTWDVGKLDEDQAEFREWIFGYLNKSWDEAAKKKGMKYRSWNYTKDAPTELLRNRIGDIIAENVLKIAMDEDKLREVTETFIVPAWLSGKNGDEILGNVMSLLLDTMNYSEIANVQKEFSCDEDFSNTKRTNYAKEDHNKRFNHTEAEQLKKVRLEELPEDLASEEDQIGQLISKIMVETVLNSFDERDRKIVEMKLYGYTQAEIATELGLSQSYVSKLEKKIREKLKTDFSE